MNRVVSDKEALCFKNVEPHWNHSLLLPGETEINCEAPSGVQAKKKRWSRALRIGGAAARRSSSDRRPAFTDFTTTLKELLILKEVFSRLFPKCIFKKRQAD